MVQRALYNSNRLDKTKDKIIITLTEITDRDTWNDNLRKLPYAHILQSWEWGEFKRHTTGWQPQRLAFERDGRIVAMANVGVRKVGPLKVMYVSKGPALDYTNTDLVNEVISALEQRAKQQNVMRSLSEYGLSSEKDQKLKEAALRGAAHLSLYM